MTTRHSRPILLAVIIVLALCAQLGMLQVRGAGAATTLKFGGATTTKTKGIIVLRATLVGIDGKPISKRPINFYEQVELMGTRQALVGSAETDSTGTATLSYHPAEDGQQTIIVRFPGDEGNAASEARGVITVSGAVPLYAPAGEPLASPARWLPRILGMLIAATWLILIGVFFITTWGVRRMGRKATAGA